MTIINYFDFSFMDINKVQETILDLCVVVLDQVGFSVPLVLSVLLVLLIPLVLSVPCSHKKLIKDLPQSYLVLPC